MSPGNHSQELQRQLLDALLNQHHMAVGVCDARGVLTVMSPAMERLLGVGYTATACDQWSARYHLHGEDGEPLPAGEDPLARALRGETVTDQVVSIQRPDEPVRWGLATGVTLTDPGRGTVGAAVFLLDITGRVVEEQRLDQLRDRLVETVNHEVRTPLAVIQGHAELIEDEGTAGFSERQRASFEAIGRASARLGEVVATISDLAEQSQRHPAH
jgi:signal transduction histidine kinase